MAEASFFYFLRRTDGKAAFFRRFFFLS